LQHGCRGNKRRLYDAHIDAGDTRGVLARPYDGGAIVGFEGEIAADMIGMVVGVENMGKPRSRAFRLF
jgi:hypothetical protein